MKFNQTSAVALSKLDFWFKATLPRKQELQMLKVHSEEFVYHGNKKRLYLTDNAAVISDI